MKLYSKLFLFTILITFISKDLLAFKDNINDSLIKDENNLKSTISSDTYNSLSNNEVINTLYEDPLSDSFMGKDSHKLNKERNRSTADLVSEFEGQAKEINDNTEVPDNIVDEHTKEDRERIEAYADKILKEAAVKESKENKGEGIFNNPDNIENNIPNSNNEETIELNKDNLKDLLNNEIDPEFLTTNTDKDQNENIEIIMTTDNEDSDEIPDYTKMQGIVTYKNEKSITNDKTQNNKKKKKKKSKKLKIFFDSHEPLLITDGNPKENDEDYNREYTFIGVLVPEKQPISRNKSMLRWVLKVDDDTKIPIKSNLKLLQEVRNSSILEDYVSISGKMRASSFDKNLKYLVPEKIVKSNKKKISSKKDTSKQDTDKGLKNNSSEIEHKVENTNKITKEKEDNNENNTNLSSTNGFENKEKDNIESVSNLDNNLEKKDKNNIEAEGNLDNNSENQLNFITPRAAQELTFKIIIVM